MQSIVFIITLLLYATISNGQRDTSMSIRREDILKELDQLTPNKSLPDFQYLSSSRATGKINLFADNNRWAIVIEVVAGEHLITHSFGNCLSLQRAEDYNEPFPFNTAFFNLLEEEELSKIFDDNGFILKGARSIRLQGQTFEIPQDAKIYKKRGIPIASILNPQKLITLPALVRYLSQENPNVFSASEEELRYYLPSDLPKIFVIENWHHKDFAMFPTADINIHKPYGDRPSSYETWQMIADILVSKDVTLWKPVLKANSDWRHWLEVD